MTTPGLKIGEVSNQTEISVGALRYYEQLGLIASVRGSNGYRYYAPETVKQVLFVKKAQTLGFSLEDISEVINIHQQGEVPCDRVMALLQEKIDKLEAQIQEALALKADLETYRDRWEHMENLPHPGDICPLIETIQPPKPRSA